jgi:hypothetical protein
MIIGPEWSVLHPCLSATGTLQGSDMMSQIRNFAVAAMRSTPQAVLAGSDEFRTGTDLWAACLDIAVIGAQKAE